MANKPSENELVTPCGKPYKYPGAFDDHFRKCDDERCKSYVPETPEGGTPAPAAQEPQAQAKDTGKAGTDKETVESIFGEKEFKDTPAVRIKPPIKSKTKKKGKETEPKVIYTLQAKIFEIGASILNQLGETKDFDLSDHDKSELNKYLEAMGGMEVSPITGILLVLLVAWIPPLIKHWSTMAENIKKKGKSLKEGIGSVFGKKEEKPKDQASKDSREPEKLPGDSKEKVEIPV